MILPASFFQKDPVTCARELIGTELRRGSCSGVVVETEAYAEHDDEACHTWFRPSARRFVGEYDAGTAYVYLNYGMYWLTNVLVKGGAANGFVLIRALEPLRGVAIMKARRRRETERDLCSGPGKLSMALGITGTDHGRSFVAKPDFAFHRRDHPTEVITCVRIGISKAKELPWRFLARNSGHVSVPARR